MKKTFLYAFAAVVLGLSIMLFPLWTFFKRYNEPGPIVPTTLKLGSELSFPVITIIPMYASQNCQNYTAERMAPAPEGHLSSYDNKGQVQPIGSSIPLSLQILAVGLIVAIGVYAVARRRITQSSFGFRYAKG